MAEKFDAIVVGSGMSGGWAAKEFTEKGMKTLLLDRGRDVKHREDYPTESVPPWELPNNGRVPKEELEQDYEVQKMAFLQEYNKHFFVKDSEHPYTQPDEKMFTWIRGYHVGGRSLTWGKQTYRWSEMDFNSNKEDGHGVDWPIRYADIEPWYDYVETFAGISGSIEGIPNLPDGKFQPPTEMTCVEAEMKKRFDVVYEDRHFIMGRCAHLTEPTEEQLSLGREKCQYRNECMRGCSFGAYFSSQSATLPAAERTGNLTTVTDAICHSVIYDAASGKATGVRVVNSKTKETTEYTGKVVFLCASTIGSTQIMLNSVSETFQNGIVVTCQSERSQHRNRETALKILKSRLYTLAQDEERRRRQEIEDQKGEIAWGNQIRSYVFQPYTLVKDHRLNLENGNVQAVMDGDIDRFIDAALLQGVEGKVAR